MSNANTPTNTNPPPNRLPRQNRFFCTGVLPLSATETRPDGDCPICHEPFDLSTADGLDSGLMVRACGHIFHTECILTWWEGSGARRNSCPMCRRDLFSATRPLSLTDEYHAFRAYHGTRRNDRFARRVQGMHPFGAPAPSYYGYPTPAPSHPGSPPPLPPSGFRRAFEPARPRIHTTYASLDEARRIDSRPRADAFSDSVDVRRAIRTARLRHAHRDRAGAPTVPLGSLPLDARDQDRPDPVVPGYGMYSNGRRNFWNGPGPIFRLPGSGPSHTRVNESNGATDYPIGSGSLPSPTGATAVSNAHDGADEQTNQPDAQGQASHRRRRGTNIFRQPRDAAWWNDFNEPGLQPMRYPPPPPPQWIPLAPAAPPPPGDMDIPSFPPPPPPEDTDMPSFSPPTTP